jgi:hypothetical protein
MMLSRPLRLRLLVRLPTPLPSVSVHAVAAAGFESQADAYERTRPSYPPEVANVCHSSTRLPN